MFFFPFSLAWPPEWQGSETPCQTHDEKDKLLPTKKTFSDDMIFLSLRQQNNRLWKKIWGEKKKNYLFGKKKIFRKSELEM